MHRHVRGRKRQQGQILVLVAGGMIGILAIAVIVLEGGSLILNRRDGQNAADVASIAGARMVALHYTDSGRSQGDVYDEVEQLLGENGCEVGSGTPCTWSADFVASGLVDLGPVADSGAAIPSGALGVRVGVNRQPGAVIGRVLNFDTWSVSTEATAITGRISGVPAGSMLPIALCGYLPDDPDDPDECGQASNSPANFIDFQPGIIYDLVEGRDAPGGFGWLSWTGSPSSTTLIGSVCTPNNPGFTLDDPYDDPGAPGSIPGQSANFAVDREVWFPAGEGKMNSSGMRTCLDGWIDSGATVLVPIYDLVVKAPPLKPTYHIVGVAAFVLTAREQPAVDQIQGRFVEYYPFLDIPGGGTTLPPGPGDISFSVGLVK